MLHYSLRGRAHIPAGGTVAYKSGRFGNPALGKVKVYGQRMAQLRLANGETALDAASRAFIGSLASSSTAAVAELLKAAGVPAEPFSRTNAASELQVALEAALAELRASQLAAWDVRHEVSVVGDGVVHGLHHLAAVAAMPPHVLFLHLRAADLARHAETLVATIADRLLSDIGLTADRPPSPAVVWRHVFDAVIVCRGLHGDLNGVRVRLGARDAPGYKDLEESVHQRNLPCLAAGLENPSPSAVARALASHGPTAWRGVAAAVPHFAAMWLALTHATNNDNALALAAELLVDLLARDVHRRAAYARLVEQRVPKHGVMPSLTLEANEWAAAVIAAAIPVYPHEVADRLLERAQTPMVRDSGTHSGYLTVTALRYVLGHLQLAGIDVTALRDAIVRRLRRSADFIWALTERGSNSGYFFDSKTTLWTIKKSGRPPVAVR